MGGFLQKLQEADEGMKRVYITIGTVVTVGIVFAVWLTFFNTFTAVREPAIAVAYEEDAGVSFGETVRGSTALIGEVFSGLLHAAGSLFSIEREVVVKPE